jgi:hypothetical protein
MINAAKNTNRAYVIGCLYRESIASYSVFIPKTKTAPAFGYSETITQPGITGTRAELLGVLCAVKHLPKGQPAEIYTSGEMTMAALGGEWEFNPDFDIVYELRNLGWEGLFIRQECKRWIHHICPELLGLRIAEREKFDNSPKGGRFFRQKGMSVFPNGIFAHDTPPEEYLDDGIPF